MLFEFTKHRVGQVESLPAASAANHVERPMPSGCPECDLVLKVPEPVPGQVARCPRCAHVLARGVVGGFARPMAYALTALVLMAIALSFPFLAVDAAGFSNAMTLATAVTALNREDAHAMAALLAAFVLLFPSLVMVATALLAGLLLARRSSPLLTPLAKSLFRLDAWCMADVFAIGVIVSLVKLSTMADVLLGTAFWAYLGFALCFLLAVTSLDRLAVWNAIDALRGQP